MKTHEALSLLNITESYTADDIKKAYRKMCSEYHPDRNPLGLHMMQLINQAYDMLRDTSGDVEQQDTDYCEDIKNALNALRGLDLDVEICGTWVWVSGDTKPHKDVLKEASFKWAPKKQMWYFRPAGERTFSRGKFTIDQIREKHGSQSFKPAQQQRLSV